MARRGKGPRGGASNNGQQQMQPLLQKTTERTGGEHCCPEAHSSAPEPEALREGEGATSNCCSSRRLCCNGSQKSSSSIRECCNEPPREGCGDNSHCNRSNRRCVQHQVRQQQQQLRQQSVEPLDQELMASGPHSCGDVCTSACSAASEPKREQQQIPPPHGETTARSSGDRCSSPSQQQQQQQGSQDQQCCEEAAHGDSVRVPIQTGIGTRTDESRVLRRQLAVDTAAARARRKLLVASAVCLVFMAIEVIAGIASNSLALMTDASHLLSDLCAFLIRWIGERDNEACRSASCLSLRAPLWPVSWAFLLSVASVSPVLLLLPYPLLSFKCSHGVSNYLLPFVSGSIFSPHPLWPKLCPLGFRRSSLLSTCSFSFAPLVVCLQRKALDLHGVLVRGRLCLSLFDFYLSCARSVLCVCWRLLYLPFFV